MKRAICLCLLLAVFLLGTGPCPGHADGYGYYGWGRSWPRVGVPDFIKEQVPGVPEVEFKLRYDHYSLGYLYDSAPGTDELLSYRFNLGLDIAVARLDRIDQGSLPAYAQTGTTDLIAETFDALGYGLTAKFALGVGLIRREGLRVWLGPSVRLSGNYLDQKAATVQFMGIPFEIDPWGVGLSAGGGAEGGVNYRFSPELTVDLSAGFHYNVFAYYQDVGLRLGSQSISDDSSFLWGREPFVFVQLALRFGFFDAGSARSTDKPAAGAHSACGKTG